MARRNRRNNTTKIIKQQEERQINKLTTKKEIMARAHEMCRQFKDAGFKFDYQLQLGLNMKYLYEISKIKKEGSKMESTNNKLIRVEKVHINAHMTEKETYNAKSTRHGIVEINGKEYYFSANRFSNMPIVFGATDLSTHFELVKLLNNKMKECGSDKNYFVMTTNEEHIMNDSTVYTKQISEGILIIKDGNKYFGYMGNRAVCFRKGKDRHPSSCAIATLIKDLDRPDKMSFRSMKGAGKRIEEELMPQFLNIITEMEKTAKEVKTTINRRPKRHINKTTKAQPNTSEEAHNESPSETPKTSQVKIPQDNNNTSKRRRRRDRRINNNEEVIESTEIKSTNNSKKVFDLKVNNFSDSQYIDYIYRLQKKFESDGSVSKIILDAISDDPLTPSEFKYMLDSFSRNELTAMIKDNKVIDEIYKSNPVIAQELLNSMGH